MLVPGRQLERREIEARADHRRDAQHLARALVEPLELLGQHVEQVVGDAGQLDRLLVPSPAVGGRPKQTQVDEVRHELPNEQRVVIGLAPDQGRERSDALGRRRERVADERRDLAATERAQVQPQRLIALALELIDHLAQRVPARELVHAHAREHQQRGLRLGQQLPEQLTAGPIRKVNVVERQRERNARRAQTRRRSARTRAPCDGAPPSAQTRPRSASTQQSR